MYLIAQAKESPPSGTDILLDSLDVDLAEISDRPALQPVLVEILESNVIKNSNLANGTNGWFDPGTACTLRVETCPPRTLPPSARSCFQPDHVSAWVRVGSNTRRGSQNVRVKLEVTHTDEKEWVNGVEVEATSEKWHKISGSYRFEKQSLKVMIYVFASDPGVDLMVAGLEIVPVDRKAKFAYLKKRFPHRKLIIKFC
ncbi:hypothetical protein TIFTF001_010054 [Ficus carica]|uniref:CBM-cenC domain-containing protein n=1 Tax=Ficus carica TaxID=3494 RepID=A0AA88AIA9_FICCA|nr:hypothetical protein TIFTF001_010054 [Ficus carica]